MRESRRCSPPQDDASARNTAEFPFRNHCQASLSWPRVTIAQPLVDPQALPPQPIPPPLKRISERLICSIRIYHERRRRRRGCSGATPPLPPLARAAYRSILTPRSPMTTKSTTPMYSSARAPYAITPRRPARKKHVENDHRNGCLCCACVTLAQEEIDDVAAEIIDTADGDLI